MLIWTGNNFQTRNVRWKKTNCSNSKRPSDKHFSNINCSLLHSHNLYTFCSSLFTTPSTVNTFNEAQQHCLYSRTVVLLSAATGGTYTANVFLYVTTAHQNIAIKTNSRTLRRHNTNCAWQNNLTSIEISIYLV
jgi:hypothetical protein